MGTFADADAVVAVAVAEKFISGGFSFAGGEVSTENPRVALKRLEKKEEKKANEIRCKGRKRICKDLNGC